MKTETIKVLLIEDDEEDYILTRDLFSQMVRGYELEWASSYEEGLEAVTRGEHDVILVDYRLGEHNGVELIRAAHKSGCTIPMIMLTGQGSHDLELEAIHAGAADYLLKNESKAEILDRMLRFIIHRTLADVELRAYAQKQAAVADIGRLALIGAELNELFAETVSLVSRTLGVEYCKLLELLPDGEALVLRGGVGWKEEYVVGRATVSAGKESQAGFTLLSGEPVIVEDLRTETRFNGPPLLHEHGVVSGVSVIIRGRERPYGVLGAHTASLRRFNSDDVNFLLSVANVLAEAISRKHADEEMAQLTGQIKSQNKRLLNIVASVPGVVWEASGAPDGTTQRIDFVSNYVETMLGYSVEEWLSTPNFWLSITHPDDRAEAGKTAAAIFADGKNRPNEFRWVTKDGRVLWVESNCTVVTNNEGQPVGLRGVTMDVTERKTMGEQLRQAQKMEAIGTLAGGIAHDFNNILGAIVGYSELAQMDVGPDSGAQAHLKQVLKASSRARDLVRQILTFSRRGDAEREVIQLQPIIDETLKLLQASLPSTIEIRQNIDGDLPTVLGDSIQIQQLIMNLCVNAGQAMKERGGVLQIGLTPIDVEPHFAFAHPGLTEGPHVRLTVSDTGCGMDRATQERIFEPFFTSKPTGEGTGLGLAVVHGVIKKHDGAITVFSEPGVGTTFNIYLPAHNAQMGAVVDESHPMAQGNGEHILFVEDEEMLATLGKSMLEHLGYRVTTKPNGAEALAAFRLEPAAFDLVITDQTMPQMDGTDLNKALLQIRPDVPVILTTGYSATMSSEKAKVLGIREVLVKPNTMQGMSEAISRALHGSRKE